MNGTSAFKLISVVLGVLILVGGLFLPEAKIVCSDERIVNVIEQCANSDYPSPLTIKYYLAGLGGLILIVGLLAFFVKIETKGGETKLKAEEKSVEKQVKQAIESIEKTTRDFEGEANISVSGLTLTYRNTKILDNVDFEIEPHELTAIIGPSGSGKSTIIESIAGRRKPNKGKILVCGKDVNKHRMEVNNLIGFVPQHAELDMNQTAWQNMQNSAIRWSVANAEEKSNEMLNSLGLTQRKSVVAKKLSGGQLKLLSMGMELIRDPELLLLDEPTTGLDPSSRNSLMSKLSVLVTQMKKTVVMTTHFMDELEDADKVIIIDKGKVVAYGSPNKLKRRMPGSGRIVSLTLEKVTNELINGVKKEEGVRKVVSEGRTLKVIMDSPNAVKLGSRIDELGGLVEETKIEPASMKEVFVYYTGRIPEE